MNLFRKKTILPEGPARMSVSPSASKKEIGNPAASIGLVIPELNGKLIGAVTHVFLNDPTRGYGIDINAMIRE